MTNKTLQTQTSVITNNNLANLAKRITHTTFSIVFIETPNYCQQQFDIYI